MRFIVFAAIIALAFPIGCTVELTEIDGSTNDKYLLILHGEFILPPYDVTVGGAGISINGVLIKNPPPLAVGLPAEIAFKALARQIGDEYKALRSINNREFSIAQVVKFASSLPGVESVAPHKNGIELTFPSLSKNGPIPIVLDMGEGEWNVLHERVQEDPNYDDTVNLIESTLAKRCLVLLSDSGTAFCNAEFTKKVKEGIKEGLVLYQDNPTKFRNYLENIIPGPFASEIAENFQQ